MAFTKITNSELNSRGATTLPNQPTISAAALKQEFDAPAKEIVAPKFNNLIDELEAETAAANIGIETPTGRIGETIQEVLNDVSSDLKNVESAIGDIDHSELEDAILKRHNHENKNVLDEFSVSAQGNLLWENIPVGGGGSNYENLENKPQINGHQLIGNMSDNDLDLASAGAVASLESSVGGLTSRVGLAESRITNLQSVTNQLSNNKADKSDLGTASAKDSTSVVTDSTDLVESGAVYDVVKGSVGFVTTGKNILPNNAQSTGIFTVNADKSVTINGSSGGSSKTLDLDLDVPVNIGTEYILSDGLDIPNSNVYIRLGKANDSYYGSTGTGDFQFTSTESKVTAKIFVASNQTVDNLTLKPMLRLATVTDDTYEPYHASVADSLEDKAGNSVIGTVEDGATASQAYAVGSYFIRNGAFCTVTTAIASGEPLVGSNKFMSRDVADSLYIKRNNLSSADDLDTIVTEGVYGIGTSAPTHAPSGVVNCPLHVHVTPDGRVVQTIIRVTNTVGDIYVRYKGALNWYNWFVIHGTEVTP